MDGKFLCQFKVVGKTHEKIVNCKVAIVGVGGTGCNAALLLGQLGVKNVKLIDPDVVELFNLPRQPLFSEKDVGRSKVRVAVEKISAYLGTEFVPVQDLLEDKNAAVLLKGIDVVLDCTDNYDARRAINNYCNKSKVPWIYSAAIKDKAMVSTFIPGKTPCFNCFAKKPIREVSCAEEGVIATSTAFAAALQVQELVNLLSGKPKLAGKMLFVNLSTFSFEFFPLEFSCKACKNFSGK